MSISLFEAPGGKLKGAEPTGLLASYQPDPPQSQTGAPESHRLTKITVRVRPQFAIGLKRIVDKLNEELKEGEKEFSLSSIGGGMVERGVQGYVDMQYSEVLKPIIQETIRYELRAFTNRFLSVISRISYHVAWLLSLTIKYMSLQLDKETFHQIETRAETDARVHITEHTPQFEEVKQRVKKETEESA